MSKKDLYRILSLYFTLSNSEKYYDDIITDDKVNDCLMDLYFSMMSQDKDVSDKHYNDFEEKYLKLSEEQKEQAKIEIAKILEIEYKPKIKKKER